MWSEDVAADQKWDGGLTSLNSEQIEPLLIKGRNELKEYGIAFAQQRDIDGWK